MNLNLLWRLEGWGKRRGIRTRYGCLGEVAGICIIERFILSLKQECTRRLLVPLSEQTLRRELELYATWYNTLRPHTSLWASPDAMDGFTTLHGSAIRV